jgi:uncharacterized protein (TIGR02594 family)
MSYVFYQCGLSIPEKPLLARSWLNIGQNNPFPQRGDIVVFWRESPASWKGHVGVFVGYSSDRNQVYCLGGNQANQVNISAYSADRVLGFRSEFDYFIDIQKESIR